MEPVSKEKSNAFEISNAIKILGLIGEGPIAGPPPPAKDVAQLAVPSEVGRKQSFSVPSNADLLRAKTRLAITRVFKTYLDLLEQIADEHDEAMGKLMDVLPPEHRASVHLADHFGEARFAAIRRKVLEAGNDSIRECHDMIDGLRLDDKR